MTACRRSPSWPSSSTAGYRIVSQPPVIVPARDLDAVYGLSQDELQQAVHQEFRAYRATLQSDRRHLLERFQIVDMARKVVGVGSVGTRAFIVLLQGRDAAGPALPAGQGGHDARCSRTICPRAATSLGQRVVQGQRMMQAASDIYLGWTKGVQEDRYLYWRQLRDMKGSADVESHQAAGAVVLRAAVRLDAGPRPRPLGGPGRHRRLPGQERQFDEAIADFSERYADQNERDYEAFMAAIASGRLPVLEGV